MIVRAFVLVALLIHAAWGRADDSPVIPLDEFVFCTVCHGVQLKGNPSLQAPRLSRMEAWYVERQLHAFKKGWRGRHERDPAGMEMRPMAESLTDKQIKAVAAYVSTVDSEIPPKTVQGNVENGRMKYVSCAACHGASAEGSAALGAPSLSGLDDWYLVTQMRNFRDGARGGSPGDNYGAQMRAAALILAEDQAIYDVVFYIGTLRSQKEK